MICSRKLSTSPNNRVPVTQKQRKQQQNKHLTVNHSTISKDSNPPVAKPQPQQQQELVSTATAFETVEAEMRKGSGKPVKRSQFLFLNVFEWLTKV